MRSLLTLCLLIMVMGCQPTQDFSIDDARIRWLPVEGPMAGYLEFRNHSDHDAQIIGARSPAYGQIMLHESQLENGQIRMQHQPSVTVPAGEVISFSPGGLHLMLMQRRKEVAPGDSVAIELQLQSGEVVPADFDVRAPGDI